MKGEKFLFLRNMGETEVRTGRNARFKVQATPRASKPTVCRPEEGEICVGKRVTDLWGTDDGRRAKTRGALYMCPLQPAPTRWVQNPAHMLSMERSHGKIAQYWG